MARTYVRDSTPPRVRVRRHGCGEAAREKGRKEFSRGGSDMGGVDRESLRRSLAGKVGSSAEQRQRKQKASSKKKKR